MKKVYKIEEMNVTRYFDDNGKDYEIVFKIKSDGKIFLARVTGNLKWEWIGEEDNLCESENNSIQH